MPRKTRRKHPQTGDQEVESPPKIIGGRFRGTRLNYGGDRRTRPMKERVREAAYNLLGDGIAEMIAIDLFAGTGALGLEAISRGAKRAIFIERHFPTCRQLRDSIESLQLQDCCRVLAGDTFFWYPRLVQADAMGDDLLPGDRPWLVFCAPPYELYFEGREEMDQLLQWFADRLPPASRLVVESDERFEAARLPNNLAWDIRPYPPAVISVGKPA